MTKTVEAKPEIADNTLISFKPVPWAPAAVEATVTGRYNNGRGTFLETVDAAGVVRAVRPGSVTVLKAA